MFKEDTDTIETIFNSEVKQKKNIARGAFAKASKKKGFKGSVIFPFDCMDKKEKKEFIKNISERVDHYNMYEDINSFPNYQAFKKIKETNIVEASKIVDAMKAHHSTEDICAYWNVTKSKLYNLRYSLSKHDKSSDNKDKNNKLLEENTMDEKPQVTKPKKDLLDDEDVFRVNQGSKCMQGEEISTRILQAVNMLNKEGKYKYKLIIEEIFE
jgi:hypothetical protein